MANKPLIIVFVVSLIAACNNSSGDLTRGKAESALKQKKDMITQSLGLNGSRTGMGCRDYRPLADSGYIVLEKIPNGIMLGVDDCRILYSDKLTPFVVGTTSVFSNNDSSLLNVADVVFDRITGISPSPIDQSSRLVEYTVVVKPTPIANLLLGNHVTGGIKNKIAEFRKYDDGWRLVGVSQ